MNERVYEYFAAALQDGYIGNLIELVERAGGPRKLYMMPDDKLVSRLSITKRMAQHIIKCREETDIFYEYDRMLREGISFFTYKDEDYPKKLRDIKSAPYGIFVKGKLPDEDKKSVAIIGARQCTEYGRLMAEYFADKLARAGVNIISGMAWGIDGLAQMSAIKAGGKSYAVLGCGVDVIYPKKNYELYEALCQGENGIISEYIPGSEAIAQRFPPRNRIISGLSDLVLVIEARAKSGTLITVDMAMEQGRSVMIVPGRITDPLSVGCLNLMQEGASPALNVNDILYELNKTGYSNNMATSKSEKSRRERNRLADAILTEDKSDRIMLTDLEAQMYDLLSLDPVYIDEISAKSQMPIEETLTVLTELEIKGLVKEVAPSYFTRNVRI